MEANAYFKILETSHYRNGNLIGPSQKMHFSRWRLRQRIKPYLSKETFFHCQAYEALFSKLAYSIFKDYV